MAEVKARASLDPRGFNAGINAMNGKVGRFSGGLSRVGRTMAGVFGVAAIASFGRKLLALGSDISDFAYQVNISAENFQVYDAAARNAGAQSENMRNALVKLNDAQGRVIDGDERMIEMFQDLGISAEQVAGMSIDELFKSVSDGITEANNSGEAYSALLQIMGRRDAPKLLEAMNQLSNEGFSKLKKDAEESGQIISEDMIATLDAAQDRLQAFARTIMTWAAEALGFFMKVNAAIGNLFSGTGQSMSEAWENAGKQLEAEREAALAEREKKLQAQQDRNKSLFQINKSKEDAGEDEARGVPLRGADKLRLQADSIAQAGGMVGGSFGNQFVNEARRQVMELKAIKQNTSTLPAIKQNTENRGIQA